LRTDISVAGEVKEIASKIEEDLKFQITRFAISLKTHKFKKEELDNFFAQPYYMYPIPKKNRQGDTTGEVRRDAWYLVIPRWIDAQFGWLVQQTASFNVFEVNRYMDWLGDLPSEVKQQIGWKDTPPLKVQGEWLTGPRDALVQAMGRYKPFVKRLDEKGILINPSRTFELLAALVKDGILPFSPKPVPAEDLIDPPRVKQDFERRDYQQEAWKKFLQYGNVGIFWPPSIGKTWIGMWGMASVKGPHLVVVPSRVIQDQWRARLAFHTSLIENQDYRVETYQSAIRNFADGLKTKDGVVPWSLVITDEAHHLPADWFSKLTLIKRKYGMGLSATPFREDEREDFIFAFTGFPVGLGWEHFRKIGLIRKPTAHVWIVKNLDAKLRRIRELLKENKRTIIFCDSIELGKSIAAANKIPHIWGDTKEDRIKLIADAFGKEPYALVGSRVLDEGVSLPDIQRIIEVDWLGACFDDKTEVLTRNGWKPFAQLSFDDYLATLAPSSKIEYHQPTDIQRYWHDGPMVRFQGRSYDLLVTPSHNMFVRGRHVESNAFTFMPAEELAAKPSGTLSSFELARSGIWEGGHIDTFQLAPLLPTEYIAKQLQVFEKAVTLNNQGSSFSEIAEELDQNYFTVRDWIRNERDPRRRQFRAVAHKQIAIEPFLKLLAWYLSEGSTDHGRGVKITQLKQEYKNDIIDAIETCGFEPKPCADGFKIYSKQLAQYLAEFGHSYEKFIPRWVLGLRTSPLRVFLKELLKGDGDGERRFYTSSKRLADDLQELVLKCGFAATIHSRAKPSVLPKIRGREIRSMREQFIIDISYDQLTPQIWKGASYEQYSGYVFDVTVPNHVLYVRRNGKAQWSGNSRRQELQRYTRLLHSKQEEEGESDILMTEEEYMRDHDRFFSLFDKGFATRVHVGEVEEERIAKRMRAGEMPLIAAKNVRGAGVSARARAHAETAASPLASSDLAGTLKLPGMQRLMSQLMGPQRKFIDYLVKKDGVWCNVDAPLFWMGQGYKNFESFNRSVFPEQLVRKGLVEKRKFERHIQYRTTLTSK